MDVINNIITSLLRPGQKNRRDYARYRDSDYYDKDEVSGGCAKAFALVVFGYFFLQFVVWIIFFR